MKLIVKEEKTESGETYFRVSLVSSISAPSSSYVFDTKPEVNAFLSGFQCARYAASSLVQELPCMETWSK